MCSLLNFCSHFVCYGKTEMHGVKGTQGETDKVKLTLLDFTTTYFTSASFSTFIVIAAELEQFQSSHSSVGFSHSSFSGFILSLVY